MDSRKEHTNAASNVHETHETKYTLTDTTSIYENMENFFEPPHLPSVGHLVKQGRTRYGLTQSALAKVSGVTIAEISRLEADKTLKPSKDIIIALAPFTGCSYTFLLLCAGYSGIFKDEIYYNKVQKIIAHEKIVADIYNADCELLELLSGINKLCNDDIQLIKHFILILKQQTTSFYDNPLGTQINKLIKTIKHFLCEQFGVITNLQTLIPARSLHTGEKYVR